MHLLVLSAFRHNGKSVRTRVGRRVSMHLLVLSAFRPVKAVAAQVGYLRLNAPFGAQCFPTSRTATQATCLSRVSMHLLVLSAFRLASGVVCTKTPTGLNAPFGAQCFPTVFEGVVEVVCFGSQCTFWCSVLSDLALLTGMTRKRGSVSMHLLVLSAFRRCCGVCGGRRPSVCVSMHLLVLSAFRQKKARQLKTVKIVSMHLLVLSAFRLKSLAVRSSIVTGLNAPFGAQCFPT